MQDIWFSPITSFGNCMAKIVALFCQLNSRLFRVYICPLNGTLELT